MSALPPDVVADLRLENARLQAENGRLFNETQEALERQTASSEILRVIASTTGDAEHALQQIAEITARLFGASSVTLNIAAGDEWAQMIRVGVSSHRVGSEVSAAQLRIGGRNLPGTVFRENRQIHIPDVDHPDPAIADWPTLPAARVAGARVMAGTPLRREGNAIGALIVHRDRPEPFTADELALLQSFADQAVIAIQNARLFNETKETLARQTATSDILRVISQSPIDVQPVFDAIVVTAARLLRCDRAFIQRCEAGSYWTVASAGLEGPRPITQSAKAPVDPEVNFPSRAILAKKTLHLPDWSAIDLPEFERHIRDLHGINSALYMPLLREDECIGLLAMTGTEAGMFGESEIALAESFRDQALIAIENTRLFNETREALERQTATAEILKVIASSPDDVQPVFDAIVNSAAKLFEPCSATITTLKDGKLHWNAVAQLVPSFDHKAAEATYPIPFDPDRSPSARAILERRIIQIPDIKAADTPEFTQRAAAAGGFRNIIFVPLISENNGIGTIILTHPQAGFKFSDRQLALLQTFADQAVIAIENVRLFNETREALERQTATAEILKVIASSPSDVQPVFEAIAASANRLIGGFSTAVHRVIDDVVHLVAFTPTNPESDEALKAAFPFRRDEMAAVAMVQNGETAQVADAETADPQTRRLGRARGWHSVTFTPLMSQGAFIGFIACTRRETGVLGDHHVQLLQTFADQAVIAIENVRLFNETQEALERQTATADILKVIASSPNDVQPVFDVIVERAVRLCGARMGRVYRYDDGMIHMVAGHGLSTPGLSTVQQVFPRPAADDTIAGRAIHSGQPYFVTDVERDETVPPLSRQMIEALGTRSQVTVPMLRSGEPIGAITVGWAEPAAYGEQQVALLQTFADQAVIAIENVRLFNETQEALERQTATADILKVIASSPNDVQPVFDVIVERAVRLCGARMGRVYRYDEGVIHMVAGHNLSTPGLSKVQEVFPRPAADDTTAGLAIRSRQPYFVTDIESDQSAPPLSRQMIEALGTRSQVTVPMLRTGEPIGAITVGWAEPAAYGDQQVALLQTFADQAVIAIENVRLFNETKEALERQTATADILKVIASSPSDVQPVFEAIAASANRLIGGFSTAVFRFVDEVAHLAAFTPTDPAADQTLTARFPRPLAEFRPFELVHGGEAAQIADTETSGVWFKDIARARGFRSMLFSPLMSKAIPIGLISVTRMEPGSFAAHHVQLLQTFADQAVIAIENVRLFNETQEALERQTATADILKVIASSPSDVQPVFEAIAASANRLIGGFSSTVFRFIDGVAHLKAFTPTTPAADEVLQATFPRPVADFPPFKMAQAGEVTQIPDTEALSGELLDIARARGYRSMLFTPLMNDGVSIGFITVTRVQPGAFAGHHVQLLRTFADQAVIAIENGRLFEEVQARTRDLTEALQQQTATADVLKVISRSAFDLQIVLDTLTQSAVELSGAKRGVIFLRDGDLFRFRASSHADENPDWIQFLKDNPQKAGRGSVSARAISTGQIVCVPDVLADPEINMPANALAGIRAALAVPLLRDGRVEGIMTLTRWAPGPFNTRQIELVQTFADQALIAIENVRLFDEVQAKTRDLTEALTYQTGSSNILRVIASSPTDVEPVLKAIVESACELCEADDAIVQLRDGDDLVFAAHRGSIPVGLQRRAINPNFIGGRAVIDKVPVHLRDVLSAEGDEFPESQEISRPLGTRTCLSVPLLRENESIGTILLRRTEVKPFSDKQIALLQTFADQAVIAIGNVRLFDEVQAKTRDLTEALTYQTGSSNILRVIASSPTDVGPVLKAIVESACELCEADDALATLRDGDDLLFMAQHGSIPVMWQRMPIRRQWASGRAVLDRKPVHVHDLLAGEGEPFPVSQDLARRSNVRTVLSVPLLRENESIGAIVLRRTEVQPFSDKQIALLQTFADQAVIAIGNVRLFDEVQARTRELSKSLDELRTAQDRLIQTEKLASLGQLTAGIAHEIKNPLNFVNNFAALSAELTDELNEVLSPAPLDGRIREEVDEITHMLKDNLQKVVQHGKRADSIVKNMLLHSREGSGEHRPADINAILDESLNLAYHGARAEKREFNVTLQRDFDEMAGTIEVFPQEITRVFLNLISNGFYAVTKRKTENGSSVFEPTIRATTRSLGDAVEIRIRDNGTGIPAEVREKMFNPFFTTKPAGEGTGLGLSMSHDIIVKQHGGRIEVETEPGEFTEFRIVLPRTKNLSDKNRGQT